MDAVTGEGFLRDADPRGGDRSCSDGSPLEFREGDQPWRATPAWAQFLIRWGYRWAREVGGQQQRRIALISLPSETAGAGLIALGAIQARLELPGANDRAAHFARISAIADAPDSSAEIFDRRHRGRRAGPYRVTGRFTTEMVWAQRVGGGEQVTISAATANYWQFAGEPPVEILEGTEAPYGPLYRALPTANRLAPIESNLAASDSAICIVGSPAGETSTRRTFDAIEFRTTAGTAASLGDLLTVHAWQQGSISRTVFFNLRGRKFDRPCSSPTMVIAHGDSAFITALAQFPKSNIVGTLNLSADRDSLEQVNSAVVSMLQWFEGDAALAAEMPEPPTGASFLLMRERNA